jgi:hypothetical protein
MKTPAFKPAAERVDPSSVKPQLLRWILLTLLVQLAILAAGCSWMPVFSGEAVFNFENRTDSALCIYPSSGDASSARCLLELGPRSEITSGRDCGGGTSGQVDARTVTVIITVKQDGREIYHRTATCGEWNDTDRRFVIEQRGDDFIVTDSLSP